MSLVWNKDFPGIVMNLSGEIMKLKALYCLILILSACAPVVTALPTSDGLTLPDLVVSYINVAQVDENGRCLGGYKISATILNQGQASAANVEAVEKTTGQPIAIDRLEAGQSKTVYLSTSPTSGNYVVVVDPQNLISESNETNNNLSFLAPTPTLVLECMKSPTVESTPMPPLASTPQPNTTPPQELIYPYYLPLVTKLENVSQTINGVTTQIDWAYADEARVAIAYTISGLDWPDGAVLDGMQQVRMSIPILSNVRLGGFSGASGNNVGIVQQGVITSSSDQLLLDGVWDAEKYPSANVNIDIPVEGPTKIGTFHFNFTVRVLNGSRIDNIDQTVVANNLSMTLKSLALNPSRVDAVLCFQLPSKIGWGPYTAYVVLGGKKYPFSGGGVLPDTFQKITDTEQCDSIGFDVQYDPSDTSLTLTVPRLQSSVNEVVTQDVIDRANQRLADKGIEFNYVNGDHSGNIEILKQPDGMTDADVYTVIWDAMADQYEGPWVFTVKLP